MFSSPAAFPDDGNEPFNNSSLNSPIWSSYDPTFTPSSGVYVNNYWNEYYYAPVYYEQQNFAAYYQPVYFNNVVYYGFYEYPVTTYFVPAFYYPVTATYTTTFVGTPDIPSEYDDEHDISYVNDFGYATLESSFAEYYQPVYFNNVVYYCFYEYPMTTYMFVPVFYYPVTTTYTTTFVGTPEVPSEYEDKHDISFVNDFGYEILENRDVCPYAGQATPSEAVTSFEIYHVEEGEHLNDAPFHSDDDDNKKEGDKKKGDDKKNHDDNGASPLGQKKSTNPDCVNESSAYKKFCSEMEERRKILRASSQVKKTFINRGVVADPSEYRKFCGSVEDRIKKVSESSPDKKSTTNRDTVKSSYRKFYSTVEERREILNSSSVRQKTYVNRGIVADPSTYKKFCQSVEEKIKKQGSLETLPSSGSKKFIDKESSKGDGVVHEENGQKFIDVVLNSREYLDVQDNIENTKKYRDALYRQALTNNPRRNKAVLLDILPSIFEEPLILDDVTAEISRGDPTVIGPEELVSKDEITKPKQRKGRWKSFRNWWSKTFCCSCKTKDPP